MNYNKRDNDLTEVFDSRWHANHNDNAKKIKEQQKEFNLKMFGIRDKEDVRKEMRKEHSVSGQVTNLQKRMDTFQRYNRNNFR